MTMPDDMKPESSAREYGAPKPVHVFRNGVNVAFRQILALVGLVLIIVAIPVAIMTPVLPIGLPMAIVGVVLLGRNAVWGRRWMEGMLLRHPRLERFAPNWLMKLVFRREKRHWPK
jgi:drug/metabolite transporter (DMT)-like permease